MKAEAYLATKTINIQGRWRKEISMYHKGSYLSRFECVPFHIQSRSVVLSVWQNFALCSETSRCGLYVPYARVQGVGIYIPETWECLERLFFFVSVGCLLSLGVGPTCVLGHVELGRGDDLAGVSA